MDCAVVAEYPCSKRRVVLHCGMGKVSAGGVGVFVEFEGAERGGRSRGNLALQMDLTRSAAAMERCNPEVSMVDRQR